MSRISDAQYELVDAWIEHFSYVKDFSEEQVEEFRREVFQNGNPWGEEFWTPLHDFIKCIADSIESSC